jgi:RND family efflux transporter MFP subunit
VGIGRADGPASPGIYRPSVRPEKAGGCRLRITVARRGAEEKVELPGCKIHADETAARSDPPASQRSAGTIKYLKEQAWSADFATLLAAERDLQPGIQVNGEIRPAAGKEARLVATTPGRVVVADPVPVLGAPVKKGQVLATIAPRLQAGGDRASLDAEAQALRAELETARAQVARAERLFAEQAIPEKQLDEARSRVRVAEANLAGARGRLQQFDVGASGRGNVGRGAFQVRSPIDGTLVAVAATSGQMVQEGDALFNVIDLRTIWLECRVFEPDIPKIEGVQGASFTLEGHDAPFTVDAANGRLVTIGRVIDEHNRTVPHIFEVANADGRLRIGQFAKVTLATGQPVRTMSLPDSAIVEDGGKQVAFVQVGGESFERRPLKLGFRSTGWVQVLDGISAGDRVVVRGAYDIKLAAAAGAVPQHGHPH